MLWATSLKVAIEEAALDEINAALGSAAIINFRTGSVESATTDADSGSLVVTNAMDDPAFGAVSTHVSQANPVTPGTATGSGTLGHFRVKNAGGTVIFQGTVAETSGGDINFDNNAFTIGDTSTMDFLSITFDVQP